MIETILALSVVVFCVICLQTCNPKDPPEKQPPKEEITVVDYACAPVMQEGSFICETADAVCAFDGKIMLCFKKGEKE